GNPPVLSSDVVEIDLSAFAALRGRIAPQRVHFIRPVMRLHMENGRYFLPTADGGRFRHAVNVATHLLSKDAEDLEGEPTESVGIVEVTEGRIIARSQEGNDDIELLSSLSAMLQWPATNRELNF